MANYVHRPQIFEVASIDQARAIILTPDGASTDQRWATETPWLAGHLAAQLAPTADSLLLDYGCGIGRLAKPLIERFGCAVLGVDASQSMRHLAPQYVGTDGFTVCAPHGLDRMLDHGLVCDHAYAVWALQHCAWPDQDAARLRRAVRPGGRLSLVNARTRLVPIEGGWLDDGVSIPALLEANGFTLLETASLPPEAAPPAVVAHAVLSLYRRD
jgi:SAM-dependent methyltransferase